jgi:hypothetical protein
MMREFSQRTIDRLSQNRLFKLLLPTFKSFLSININKEIEKNRYAIYQSAEAQKNGRQLDDSDTELLLKKAREIDEEFLRKASSLSPAINIRYDVIEQVRKKRIERLLQSSYQILNKWQDTPRIRVVIASIFDRKQFHLLLRDILSLYIDETKILSNSVKIPHALFFVRDSVLQTIHSVMAEVAEELASELTSRVYREQDIRN